MSSNRERAGTNTRRRRALVAEDETLIRLDLKALLERADFEVCAEAKDGAEAVELARVHEPDLAIMDVRMPRLDGIEAARRIHAERPIPIVMLTAFSDRRLVSRAIGAGAFAYLVKPFREQDLLPAIEAAAARHDDLLAARRELGRKPQPEPPLDVVVTGSAGRRWPLRITRSIDGSVDVSPLTDE
jgi:two-component system, response regulator PdtaR